MGQTLAKKSYEIESLDQVQEEIINWYEDGAKPFIQEHRALVWKAALAEAEKTNGALLETCDEGTLCREKITKKMKEDMMTIWKKVLKEFETSIKTSVADTKTEVETAW